MRRFLLDFLVDPVEKSCFSLERKRIEGDELEEGSLRSPRRTFLIRNGIPRFAQSNDDRQKQTEISFGYKWSQLASYDSPHMRAISQKWLIERYGFKSIDEIRNYFSKCTRVLDAGCGSGFSASLWMDPNWRGKGHAEWIGVDISSAIDVARQRLGAIPGTSFIQADILDLPFEEHAIDTIISEGALHHTPSTEKAFQSLLRILSPGGEILFYVYRKKGPIREFTDDYIRNLIASLEPEQAWERLRPLTRLGQALASMKAVVRVEDDVPDLGIHAGVYDIQRFLYWNFAKLFWNEAFSFDENHHVNFDWYHPSYAHRHTEEEVRRWCREAGLSIVHFDAQESGFTVRARSS